MLRFLFLFCFALLAQIGSSQDCCVIKGNLVDGNTNINIEYANIVLNTIEGNYLLGTVSEMNGNFSISVEHGEYLLAISMIGYENTTISVDYNSAKGSILDVGTISIREKLNSIDGVEIVSRRPKFIKSKGNLTVDVENTILSMSGDGVNMLRNIPSLIVSQDNQIGVFGKGNASVYIDGRKIVDPDELRLLNSQDIKKVEVIRNPTSIYDADGGAIILITLLKSRVNGFSNKIMGSIGKGEFYRGMIGASTSFKNDFFSLVGSYRYNPNKKVKIDQYSREFSNSDGSLTRMENTIESISDYKNVHSYRIGADFDFSSNQSLEIGYNYSVEGDDLYTDNVNIVENLLDQNLNVSTITNAFDKNSTSTVSMRYVIEIDSFGQNLFIHSDYTQFNSIFSSLIDETLSNADDLRQKENLNNNSIKLYTAGLGYEKGLNDEISFQVGGKFSRITNLSDLTLKDIVNNNITEKEGYLYKEDIYASYFQLEWELDYLAFGFGLRYEFTDLIGEDNELGTVVVDNSYSNFFPSAGLEYDISEDVSAGIYYSKRISRPEIQSLNPFINYIDTLSVVRGNPQLLSETIDEFELSIEHSDLGGLEFSYNKTSQPIYGLVSVENFITKGGEVNLLSEEEFTVGINTGLDLEFWSSSIYTGIGYVFNTKFPENLNYTIKNQSTLEFSTINTFYLPKKYAINLQYSYTSAIRSDLFILEPLYFLNLSISKKYLNDRLNVAIQFFDVFDTYRYRGSTQAGNLLLKAVDFSDQQALVISFKYQLNTKLFKEKEKIDLPDELERIRKE